MALRHVVRELSPPWLRGGQAERFMYSLALLADSIVDKATEAIDNRRPDVCDESSLPVIASDRLLRQGTSESNDAFRVRLQTAFDSWQLAGGPWRTLREPLRTLLAKQPMARMVSNRYELPAAIPSTLELTKWHTYAEGADTEQPPAYLVVEPGNWDWDSVSKIHGSWSWARIWVVIYSVGGETWCAKGTHKIGDHRRIGERTTEHSIGFDTSAAVFGDLVAEVKKWKAQHASLPHVVVAFDASLFDPAEASGGGINPDGHFGRWGKWSGTTWVQSRTVIPDARWCASVD